MNFQLGCDLKKLMWLEKGVYSEMKKMIGTVILKYEVEWKFSDNSWLRKILLWCVWQIDYSNYINDDEKLFLMNFCDE